MSLKEHISLLIEKAFTSRKAWVSQQSFPNTRISLSTSTRAYTAPADGWFGVYSSYDDGNSYIQVYSRGFSDVPVVRFTDNATASTDHISLSVPVAKGFKAGLFASVDPTEVWFSPTCGDS